MGFGGTTCSCNTSLPHVLLRGLYNLQHIVLTIIDATSFGTVATLLEMIPVASVLFSFTNTGEFQTSQLPRKVWECLRLTTDIVGAALWAADIEAKEIEMAGGTAPELRETAKKAE